MKKIYLLAALVIVFVVSGFFLQLGKKASAPVNSATIVSTDVGYSPKELRVELGTIVTFKNESAVPVWTASAMHPTHTVYGGTTLKEHCPDVGGKAFDACEEIAPGASWSFKFDIAGTWKYHDHLNPSHYGGIVVE